MTTIQRQQRQQIKNQRAFFLVFGLLPLLSLLSLAVAPSEKATISSDELELRDNGAISVFSGNVVLKQSPYTLHADRMVRTKATGIVTAKGRIRAVRTSPTGEKILAQGDFGRYTPAPEGSTIELWGHAKVTRWETAVDTAPMVVIADRLTAREVENSVWAQGHVRMRQAMRLVTVSDEARYDHASGTLDLWGAQPVQVHVEDSRGSGDFVAERAWLRLNPKQARLVERVRGHIIPSPS